MRRNEEHITKRAIEMRVGGRRKRGRPRRRWMDCIQEDLRQKGLTSGDAADRQRWKIMARNGDPT